MQAVFVRSFIKFASFSLFSTLDQYVAVQAVKFILLLPDCIFLHHCFMYCYYNVAVLFLHSFCSTKRNCYFIEFFIPGAFLQCRLSVEPAKM